MSRWLRWRCRRGGRLDRLCRLRGSGGAGAGVGAQADRSTEPISSMTTQRRNARRGRTTTMPEGLDLATRDALPGGRVSDANTSRDSRASLPQARAETPLPSRSQPRAIWNPIPFVAASVAAFREAVNWSSYRVRVIASCSVDDSWAWRISCHVWPIVGLLSPSSKVTSTEGQDVGPATHTSIGGQFATLTAPGGPPEGATAGGHLDDRAVRGGLRGGRLGHGRNARASEGRVAANVHALPGGIPSHDKFGQVFARLDPEDSGAASWSGRGRSSVIRGCKSWRWLARRCGGRTIGGRVAARHAPRGRWRSLGSGAQREWPAVRHQQRCRTKRVTRPTAI